VRANRHDVMANDEVADEASRLLHQRPAQPDGAQPDGARRTALAR
jgi:hypothetical protein